MPINSTAVAWDQVLLNVIQRLLSLDMEGLSPLCCVAWFPMTMSGTVESRISGERDSCWLFGMTIFSTVR
jgi:hypothetical protein